MDRPAAPPAGRRPSLSTAVLVVALLLLTPPLFLLAPLALLLLFSRPTKVREWLWIALAAAGSAKFITDVIPTTNVALGVVTAGGLIAAVGFVGLTIGRPQWTSLGRAVGAVAVGILGAVAWAAWMGISIEQIDQTVAADLQRVIEQGLIGAPPEQVKPVLAAIPAAARAFPGWIALPAIAGLLVCWRWYYLVAADPRPPAPGKFREFRFNDHLVWGAIFTLGLGLVPLGETVGRIASSGLVVWVGLYSARGLAVTASTAIGWPFPGKLLLFVVGLLALPIALGTMTALGLADTWLNFRNRSVPTGGDDDANRSDSP